MAYSIKMDLQQSQDSSCLETRENMTAAQRLGVPDALSGACPYPVSTPYPGSPEPDGVLGTGNRWAAWRAPGAR